MTSEEEADFVPTRNASTDNVARHFHDGWQKSFARTSRKSSVKTRTILRRRFLQSHWHSQPEDHAEHAQSSCHELPVAGQEARGEDRCAQARKARRAAYRRFVSKLPHANGHPGCSAPLLPGTFETGPGRAMPAAPRDSVLLHAVH